MRVLGLLLLCVGAAQADDPVPSGTPVSKPLQPVALPDEPSPPPAVTPATETKPPEVAIEPPTGSAVMPSRWSSYDLLLWWSKAQPMPNLVTGTPGPAPVVAGGPGTRTLVGGESLGDGMHAGFRFTMGWATVLENAGVEFSGLFLGTRVDSARFTDSAAYAVIGRPYIDAFTGLPATLPVGGAGVGVGGVEVTTTTRVQGWELNGVRNLVDAGDVAVTALVGYRYFGVNEGLHVAQSTLHSPVAGQPPSVLWGVYDQFDARNNYHGGQVGLKIDAVHGCWLLNLSGKVAFGTNFESVIVEGGSSATTAALPVPAVQRFSSGFLAGPTNEGRVMQSQFAVLPEARLNLGVQIGTSSFFFVGYNFFYLSDAVRPGDQVDLTIDPTRSPILSDQPRIAVMGPARPQQSFVRSDFWAHGLVLGLDCRY